MQHDGTDAFPPVDVQIGDPTADYRAVAVAPDMHRLAWLDGQTQTVWLCAIDRETGDLVPSSGRGTDCGILPAGTGRELLWHKDVHGWSLVFPCAGRRLPPAATIPFDLGRSTLPRPRLASAVPFAWKGATYTLIRTVIRDARFTRSPSELWLVPPADTGTIRRLSPQDNLARTDFQVFTGRHRIWAFGCARGPLDPRWQLHRIETGLGDDTCRTGPVHRDIVYGTGDRKPLLMDIYEPAGNGGMAPAILYIHGGSWMRGEKSGDLDMIDIRPLVEQGYVVAALNYRLSPAYLFPAQLEDVKCAVRYLRSHAAQWRIDPDRIGAAGGSAGGHLAAMLGLTRPSDGFEGTGGHADASSAVQAVCDMYGPSDLAADYNSVSRVVEVIVLRRRDRHAPELAVASPVTYVHPGAPPFLLLQGTKDDVVVPHQSELLAERLQAAHIPVQYVAVQNAAHCFHPAGGPIEPSRRQLTDLMCAFFRKTLGT